MGKRVSELTYEEHQKSLERQRKKRELSREETKAKRHEYYLSHRQHEIETAKRWNVVNNHLCRERRKLLHEKNKDKERQYNRNKINTDPKYKMLHYVCKRINRAMRDSGNKRLFSTADLIGCTWEEFVSYIEKQFKPGMAWENHGEWHIDHIKPCALFDLSKPEEQKACFHFTNVQPLWAVDNMKKGAKYGL